MTQMLMKLWKDEEGATAVEYGIMVALIAVAVIATVQLLGGSLNTTFDTVEGKVSTANTAAAG